MAYYFLTASKDASVYLQQPNQNTGLDEILEVSKVYYGNVKDVSHALLKFDIGFLSQSLYTNTFGMNEAVLILKEAQAEEIPLDYTIYANPISGSWQMGNGTRFDAITTKGVTWNYREGDTKSTWLDNDFNSFTTASINDGSGGTWWTAYGATQNFSYEKSDINMDVKSMLRVWMSGSIPNDGLMLKFADYTNSTDLESNTQDYGILRFFSKETFTIYQPKIRIGWDDQLFQTGSLEALTSENIKVGVKSFKSEYKKGSNPKIRIFGRELYPIKTFTNQFGYTNIKYLPETTYYQIKDVASDDIIVPFSDYSKVSCDMEGNYIKLNLSNWEANRVYKIEFKVNMSGDITYYDDSITFNIAAN
jgi:hypothetical protein